MNTSAKHMQFSVLTGLILISGLTIGFAKADSSVLPSVAQTFVMVTANDIESGPFAGAKFDIVSFMSHPCYTMAGVEVKNCSDTYGITEPLSTYVENGMLLSWLQSNALMPHDMFASSMSSVSSVTSSTGSALKASTGSGMDTATGSAVTVTVEEEEKEETTVSVSETLNSSIDTEAEFETLRATRASKLWAICLRLYGTRAAASGCYQDNFNLMMRLDTPLEGNVR